MHTTRPVLAYLDFTQTSPRTILRVLGSLSSMLAHSVPPSTCDVWNQPFRSQGWGDSAATDDLLQWYLRCLGFASQKGHAYAGKYVMDTFATLLVQGRSFRSDKSKELVLQRRPSTAAMLVRVPFKQCGSISNIIYNQMASIIILRRVEHADLLGTLTFMELRKARHGLSPIEMSSSSDSVSLTPTIGYIVKVLSGQRQPL
ncbi:hypothetical protein KC323_g45 [Hortaea werneckii]|nr:hypothetical protein KC323_g45 [Hortaea werneckii]